ncbi:hypothetical protein ACIPUB_17390 [Paeniglutamicibacter sp. ORCA_105]|uniref:hypothetical protein n=1 Tax=Paeniglutamicibacter sp. ORCA_105 TaxID=3377336 RepID=UPI003893AF04
MKFVIACLVIVIPLTWAAAYEPWLAIAGIAAILSGCLFWFRQKAAAGIGVLAVLFGGTLEHLTQISVLGYVDEGFVVLAASLFTLRRLAGTGNIRGLPGGRWFLIYAILGAISSAIAGVAPLLAAQSGFLMLKGVILAFGMMQLDWKQADIAPLAKSAGWVIMALLACTAINFAAPTAWNAIFAQESGGVQIRYGMPSLIGPFTHPGLYGPIMALAAVALVAYRSTVRKSPLTLVMMAGSFIGAIFSFRRKVLAAAVVGMLAAKAAAPGRKAITITFLVLAAPVAAYAFSEEIVSMVRATYDEYLVNPEESSRTLFYIDSVKLAALAFPFGVGFARYGSFLAGQEYSPEYVALGYDKIYGLGTGENSGFLSDTFWPAIVGETGFIGAIAYTIGLFMLARPAFRLARRGVDRYHRFMGVLAVAWLAEFLIESIAGAVFSSPPMFPLLFGALAIAASMQKQSEQIERKAKESVLA